MLDKIKGKHILIDGDIVKYRCAASAEKTKYLVTWNPGITEVLGEYDTHKEALTSIPAEPAFPTYIWSRKEVQPLECALQACKTTISSLLTKLEPSKVSIFLSPDRTFRNDVAKSKPYKGNRTQPKPKYLKEVEKYLEVQYGSVFGDNIEADDEIGIHLSNEGESGVSVSIDKDLLQVPGWHYNWVNDTVQWVSPKQADFNFYEQLLTGDATDNVPGCPGVGGVGAKRALSGAGSSKELCTRVWIEYRNQFDDADKARAYLLEQATLLYILRERGKSFKFPIQLI